MTEGRSRCGDEAIRGQTLEDQEGVREPGEGQVAVQAVPAAALVVVQAALPLGVLVALLDHPAGVGQGDQPRQGRLERPPGQPQEVLLVSVGSDTAKDPGPWEGELRNMWKPTQQEALWFHGGNLQQSRFYSLILALQIKARQVGLPTPVYGQQPVHHLS